MNNLSHDSSFAVQPLPLRAAESGANVSEFEGRVLVVEDNPITQLLTLQQLRQLGCTASAASSGGEAVEARKSEHFDLILLDCRLPDMDGYETARAIRKYERISERQPVAIVAVTADDDLECVDKCISAGMDAHLPKPTSVGVLRDILARYLK